MADTNQRIVVTLAAEGSQLQAVTAAGAQQLGAFATAAQRAASQLNPYSAAAANARYQTQQLQFQLTDIVSGLTTGQSPFTVLVQQGGQLKDMFGGVGPAAQAMGRHIAALVTPTTTVAAGLALMTYAAYEGRREQTELANAMQLSGNAAGMTGDRFRAFAATASAATRTTIGDAKGMAQAMVASGQVSSQNFDAMGQSALLVQRATGATAETVVRDFAAMQGGVAKWAEEHNKAWNYIGPAQLAYIRRLEEQHKGEQAIAENTELVRKHFAGMDDNLGALERSWAAVKSAASSAWDAMLGVGRQATIGEQIERLQQQLQGRAELKQRVASGQASTDTSRNVNSPAFDAGTAQLAKELANLQARQSLEEAGARARAEIAARNKKAIEEEDEARQRAGARLQAQLGQITAAEALKQEGYKRTTDVLATQLALGNVSEQQALQAQYTIDAAALDSRRQSVAAQIALLRGKKGTEQELAKATGELRLLEAQGITLQTKLEGDLEQAAFKRSQVEVKANEAAVDAWAKSNREIEASIAKAKDETLARNESITSLGLGRAALADMKAARLEEQATIAEGMALKVLDKNLDEVQYQLYKDKAKALRDLAAATRGEAAAHDQADAAKAAVAEWQKAADQINQSLTDALMTGGKKGADYLASLFRTLVLRPVVQFIGTPISAAVSGMLGMGAPAGAMAGQGGGTSLSSLGSLGGLLGGNAGLGNVLGGFKAGMGAWGSEAGLAGTWSGATTAIGAGNLSGGLGTMAGMAGAGLGGFMAGRGIGQAISGGYSVSGGNAAVNIGSVAGLVLGGPIGAAIGGAIGGVVNRAFGHQARANVGDATLSGSITAGGGTLASRQNWIERGGWFVGDNVGTSTTVTDATTALSAQVQAQIAATFGQMQTAVHTLTGGAALASSQLDTLAVDFANAGIAFDGSAESAAAALSYTSDAVVRQLVPSLVAFQKTGETLSATATRLTTEMGAVDAAAARMGGNLAALGQGLGSAGAKSALVEAFGSADAFNSAIGTYYAAFYSGTEQVVGQGAVLRDAFGQIGVAMPATRAEFRALVSSLDLTTEAGAKEYASLLQLAGAFDQQQQAIDGLQATITGLNATLPMLTAGMSDSAKAADALESLDQQLRTLRDAAMDPSDVAAQVAAQQQLQSLTLQRYQAELQLANSLYQAAADNLSSIASLREQLRGDITGLRGGPTVMTAAQIAAAVARVKVGASPSDSKMLGAQARVDEWMAKLQAAQTWNAQLASVHSGTTNALGALDTANTASKTLYDAALKAQWDVLTATFSSGATRTATPDSHSISLADYVKTNGLRTDLLGASSPFSNNTLVQRFGAFQDAMLAYQSQLKDVTAAQDAYNSAVSAEAAWKAAHPAPTTTEDVAQAQKLAAQTQLSAAQASYYAALNTYIADAAKGVDKLTTLREETLRYYEAQKALADQMQASAAGLRSAIDTARYNDMTGSQQLSTLQARFDAAYQAAKTASGSDLAAYGDTMQSLLQSILDKAKDNVGVDYIKLRDTLLSQAGSVADRIDKLVPKDYVDKSVALLGQIDASLAKLQDASSSAQALIVDAINLSRDSTVAGLRAVIAAIQGGVVPGFASGGLHAGGLRIVGERGPELEATGAARIWSAQQTRAMLAGASDTKPVAPGRVDASMVRNLLASVSASAADTAREQRRSVEALGGVSDAVRAVESAVVRAQDAGTQGMTSAVRDMGVAVVATLREMHQGLADRVSRLELTTERQGRQMTQAIELGRGRGLGV